LKYLKIIHAVAAMSLTGFLLSPAALAADVALVGDAHVSSTRSTTNFGALSNLNVGNGNTTLLQFDLTTLPAGTISSQIARATLTVYVNRINAGGAVTLSPVTSAWNELTVTYATIPSLGAATSTFTPTSAGNYVAIDITSLVQGWVTNPGNNYGIALGSATANLLLDSKENDETGHAATLDITITSQGATGAQGIQGPAGATGATGAPGANGPAGAVGATGASGATGPAGTTGATGTLGAVANWSSTSTYQVGNVVFCAACSTNGSSYIALAVNTNQDPPTQTGFWQLIAQVGAVGAQGIQGVDGPTGPQGIQGSIGSQGIQGATGTLGAVSNWSSSSTYQVGNVVFCAACSTNGSSYIAVAVNTNQDPPTQTGFWQLIAQVGAVGAQGTQGIQGIQGPAGAAGAQGPQGAAGTTGNTGATGTIGSVANWSGGSPYTVGQVVFCAGACSSSGSSFVALATNTNIDPPTNPAIWRLIAQAGATGPAGPTGATGTTGATGAAGSITNGFVWSSLVGNQGDQGPFYVSPLGNNSPNEANASQVAFLPASAACTIRSLTINALATNVNNPIVADTMVFTVIKNDAASSMTCSIATTNGTVNGATLSCADSTHTFTVVQGDRISLEFTESINSGFNQFINAGTTLVCF
jgi:hypothetical protein